MSYQDHLKQNSIEQVIKTHTELVRKIAFHIHGRISASVEVDDLVQVGFIGLIEAAKSHNKQEHSSFQNYAAIRIKGAIIDQLRRNSNLTRNTIRMQQLARKARDDLEKNLGREPYSDEIAKALNISAEEYAKLENLFQGNFNKSLDETYDEFSLIYSSGEENQENQIDHNEKIQILTEALKELPEREALIIQLYYVEELNVHEIAEIVGVSTGRISQIKSSAFKRLREILSPTFSV